MDLYTRLFLEQITNKDPLHSTGNSAQWYGWHGSLGENEYMYMYGWVLWLFTWNYHNIVNWLVNILIQNKLLIVNIPIQNKKFFFKRGVKKKLEKTQLRMKWNSVKVPRVPKHWQKACRGAPSLLVVSAPPPVCLGFPSSSHGTPRCLPLQTCNFFHPILLALKCARLGF